MKFRLIGLLALISMLHFKAQAEESYSDGYVSNSQIADNGCGCSTSRFSLEGDFLYWKPSALVIGNISQETTNGPNITSMTTDKRVKKRYFPGYRLGVFYQDECMCWKLGLKWTHVDTKATSSFVAPLGGEAILALDQNATAKLTTKLDYVDFDISARARILPCFFLTPHIGVRGLLFSDRLHIFGTGSIPENPAIINSPFTRVSDSMIRFNSYAYGIEGGFWLEWNVGCGLSILGHCEGAVLYIHGKSKTVGTIVDTSPTGTIVLNSIGTIRQRREEGVFTFNYFIGGQYVFNYCDLEFAVKAGWEHFCLITALQNGDYEGLTAGLTISF